MPDQPHVTVRASTLARCVLPFLFASLGAQAETQHFAFISDTQYPWTDRDEPSNDARDRRSRELILEQGHATRAFRQAHGGLDKVPLFLNGDVTAFGHGWQRSFMFGEPFKKAYERNVYWLLGNHDYQNNVNDCASNGCAADMITTMASHADSYPYRVFDYQVTDNGWARHRGSLAYSIQFGQVLAIQLQNEPTYTTRFESHRRTFDITPSLDLLEQELAWARAAGKDVILNMHKPPGSNWQGSYRDRFGRLLAEYDDIVLAIFAGHLHHVAGKFTMVGKVPVYLSGSTDQKTWLTAAYDTETRRLTVKTVRNNDWNNSISSAGESTGSGTRGGVAPDIRDYATQGWGSWGPIAMCPEGQFIASFSLKSEGDQGNGDDSAANGMRFWCTPGDRWDPHLIKSKEGKWGEWDAMKQCRGSAGKARLNGIQMRIEKDQGSGDDSSLNNVRMQCTNGEILEGTPPVQWGDWQAMHHCPDGMAMVGFMAKVEDDQGPGDDTALNRIQMFCRPYPG